MADLLPRASGSASPLDHALAQVAAKLHEINAKRLANGAHSALQLEHWTWRERALHLESTARLLTRATELGERPTADSVYAVAAVAVARARTSCAHETMPARRVGHLRRADAGSGTAHRDRCTKRRFARQRGNRTACGKDLRQHIARSTLGGAFTKTGAPSGIRTSALKRRGQGARQA